MRFVIGLDLSLTATGVAMVDLTDGEIFTWRLKTTGRKGATATETALRISGMVRDIGEWISDQTTAPIQQWRDWLAVIESPSFGSKGGAAHERGGLWWGVAGTLADMAVPIATVAPTSRALYATGNGRADKKEVIAAVRGRHPEVDIPDDNVADALTLAAMGARHLGKPIDAGRTDRGLTAMSSAKWP
ncbi:MAG TPA: hypothetical protein VHO01_16465 [Jatrophihabitans sp.]|nr:hypothetical protein [Jatrophihabitans sp.]